MGAESFHPHFEAPPPPPEEPLVPEHKGTPPVLDANQNPHPMYADSYPFIAESVKDGSGESSYPAEIIPQDSQVMEPDSHYPRLTFDQMAEHDDQLVKLDQTLA